MVSIAAGVFEMLVDDAKSIAWEWRGARTATALYIDRAKAAQGQQGNVVYDMLVHLLALRDTAVLEGDREQVDALVAEVQQEIGNMIELAYVDQATPK